MKINDIDEPTSLILALIKMANADNDVHNFEQMNINLLTNTLGVSHSKLDECKANIDDYPIVAPKTKNEKLDYFWRILTMMKMDMHADEQELVLCKELGLALKLSLFEVTALITYMVERLNEFVPFEQFMEYYNEEIKNHADNYSGGSFFQRLKSLFS